MCVLVSNQELYFYCHMSWTKSCHSFYWFWWNYCLSSFGFSCHNMNTRTSHILCWTLNTYLWMHYEEQPPINSPLTFHHKSHIQKAMAISNRITKALTILTKHFKILWRCQTLVRHRLSINRHLLPFCR